MLSNAVAKALEHGKVKEQKPKWSKWKVATTGSGGGSLSTAAGTRIRRASVTLMAALGLNKAGDGEKDEDSAHGQGRSKVGKMLRKASLVMNLGKGKQRQQDGMTESEQIKNDPALAAVAAATADAAQKSGKKAVKELKKRVRRASIVLLATTVGSKINAVKSATVQQKATELEDLKRQKQALENAATAASQGNINSAAVVVATASAVTSSGALPQEASSSEEDEYDELSSRPETEPERILNWTGGPRVVSKMDSGSESSLATSATEIASSEYHTAKTQNPLPSNAKSAELEVVGTQMAADTADMSADHTAISQPLSLTDGSLRSHKPGGTSLAPTPSAATVPLKDTTTDDSISGSKARGVLLGGLRSGELEASVLQMREAAAYSARMAAATAEQAAAEESHRLAAIRRAEEERIAAEETAAAAQTAAEHAAFCRQAGVPLHGPGRSL
jgi:archaellum component FlaC